MPKDKGFIGTTDDENCTEKKGSTLDAKCMDKRQGNFGFTNRGELIPCCWLDTQGNRKEEAYKKLLSVSSIKDHDSVEDIIMQKEWIDFFKGLKEGRGFPQCHHVCKKREKPQHQKQTFYEPNKPPRVRET